MKEIRALVADDELPARGELTYELSNIPGVKVIGECGNGREVLAFLKTHPNVDILFLDIEMPLMNGLECAKEIVRMDLSVKVVFATGYSQFAVKAFDLEAFDYILKPYDEARIARTISRLADSLVLMEKERVPGEIVSTSQKISLQTQGKTIMISPAQEIILISSEKSDRALFYTTRGIIESKMTLRDIESLLSPRLLPHAQGLHREPFHDPGNPESGQWHPAPDACPLPQRKSARLQALYQGLQEYAPFGLDRRRYSCSVQPALSLPRPAWIQAFF